MPFLDVAVTDPNLIYARAVQDHARLTLSGVESVEVQFNNAKFRFAIGSKNLGLEIHHVGGHFFEENELRFIQKAVPRRAVIVDVGANVGNHAIFFAGMLAPALLVPVEPVPDAVEALKRNLALNALSVDERALGVAASDRLGFVSIELGTERDLVQASVRQESGRTSRHQVPCKSLDEIVEEKIDFLKIDVEGFELPVLAGCGRILRDDKPLLMIEAHNHQREDILRKVSAFGYRPIAAFTGAGYQNIFLRVW